MGKLYAVVFSGGRYVVLNADNPKAAGRPVFPDGDGLPSYERARRFADHCNVDIQRKRVKENNHKEDL